MKLRVIIVEDEKRSMETLKNLLKSYCEEVEVVAMATNVNEGIKAINMHRPDLVFLDIEMQSHTGFDLLDQVEYREFEVIFTTAFEQYAIKAIKFSAFDYLLKPLDPKELQEAVRQAAGKISNHAAADRIDHLLQNIDNSKGNSITLSTAEGIEFVQLDEIVRIEANGAYTNFYLKRDRQIMVSKNLKEYERLLSEFHFLRIHNSNIINLKEVKRYIKSEGGAVEMKNGDRVPISHSRKEGFLEAMKMV
jgi:two-component system LytT family response regulator